MGHHVSCLADTSFQCLSRRLENEQVGFRREAAGIWGSGIYQCHVAGFKNGAAVVLFVPQGIVIREGVFAFLLNTLLGVPIHEAIVAAALTRLIATAAEGVWAAIALRF